MNNVVPFQFDEYEIRAIRDEHAQPWFVAKDVCEALEIGNTSDALGRLDDDEVDSTEVIDGLGRKQMTNIVNEAGLYSLIMNSRKSGAHRFKRWITHEVLPSLRRTGSYSLTGGSAHCRHLHSSPKVVAATFRSFASIARSAGLKGHQVALCANTATRKLTGVDCLALMDATRYLPVSDVLHFAASELAERIGVSSEVFDDLLVERGMAQRIDGMIQPTRRGETFALVFDTGNPQGGEAPVQQVKWLESVLEVLDACDKTLR
jgi:prophage antirepressor-like protein